MNQAQATELFLNGHLLAIGEYRMTKTETIKWLDKTNGKPLSAPVCRHTVEFGDLSMTISERVPDGVPIEAIKVPWVKGERVLVRLSEYSNARGVVSGRGTLEKLDVTPSPVTGQTVSVPRR